MTWNPMRQDFDRATAELLCAPAISPEFRLVGEPIGKPCPACHHSNVVHDTHRNVCVLCDLQQLAERLRERQL